MIADSQGESFGSSSDRKQSQKKASATPKTAIARSDALGCGSASANMAAIDEPSRMVEKQSVVKSEENDALTIEHGYDSDALLERERERVTTLKTQAGKLHSQWSTAMKDLSYRAQQEGKLEDREQELSEGIAEQIHIADEAREAKREAERQRKTAEVAKSKLLAERLKVEVQLENFRSRGTFSENEERVDDLEEQVKQTEKDLENAENVLKVIQSVPNISEVLPYLEMLRDAHKREPAPLKERAEFKASSQGIGKSPGSRYAKSEAGKDEASIRKRKYSISELSVSSDEDLVTSEKVTKRTRSA